MRTIAILLASLVAVPALVAQRVEPTATPSLIRGARVRATTALPPRHPLGGHRSVVGELTALDADSVVVMTSFGRVALPRTAVTRLDVHAGTRPRGQAMLKGAAVGLVIGGAGGGLAGRSVGSGGCDSGSYCLSRDDMTTLGGVMGGLAGLVVGALVGDARSGERWQRVPIDALARVGLVTPTQVAIAIPLR